MKWQLATQKRPPKEGEYVCKANGQYTLLYYFARYDNFANGKVYIPQHEVYWLDEESHSFSLVDMNKAFMAGLTSNDIKLFNKFMKTEYKIDL